METLYKKIYITRWIFEERTSDSQQTPEILEEIGIIKKTPFIEICEIENSVLFLTLSKLVDEGEALQSSWYWKNKRISSFWMKLTVENWQTYTT